ncbi:MAG: hypothetical protein KDD02_23225 [Phaeodactylibacter sp.]|nr:hypothetical protein [Phaeodactylibacter sp.]MCB9302491.1 hypothetical protein [Lewinellaceae bacterium]
MKIFALVALLPLLLSFNSLPAQDFFTENDQSPIIQGTRAYVQYQNEENVDVDVPEELLPLLAGLLLTNDVELNNCQQAIGVWIDKYQALDRRIRAESDPARVTQARQALKAGDFNRVEQILNLKTDYRELASLFPNMFQSQQISTSGAQSPIIIGDQATVSYVVKRVISYQLPERVTKNLLTQLKNEQESRQSLQNAVASKDQIISDWVKKYRAIEVQLKNSPDELSREAYRFFSEGDLDQAMAVLKKLDGSKEQIANASYLQARIMMLQFDNAKFDSLSLEVARYYKQAAALSDDFEMHRDYAMYLAEGTLQYQAALGALQEAKKYVRDDRDLIQILTEEAWVLYFLQNYEGSEKKSREALEIASRRPHQQDTLFLSSVTVSQTSIANCLALKANALQPAPNTMVSSRKSQEQFQKIKNLLVEAVHFDSLSLQTMDSLEKYAQSPADWRLPNRFVSMSNLALRTAMISDYPTSRQVFESTLEFMENNYAKNPFQLIPKYSMALFAYGGFLVNTGDTEAGQNAYEKALGLLESVANSEIQASYNMLRQAYQLTMNAMLFNCQPEKALQLMEELSESLEPYALKNPDGFSIGFQEIDATRVWLMHRLGKEEQGAAICQKLVKAFYKNPVPSYLYIQGSVNSLLSFAQSGYWTYVQQSEFDSAVLFVRSIYPLMDRLRSVSPQFQTMIDCNLLNLDLLQAAALREKGEWEAAKTQLDKIHKKATDFFKADPVSAMAPFLQSARALAKYHSDKGDFKLAKSTLEDALEAFRQRIPEQLQAQFGMFRLATQNDLLRRLAALKDIKAAEPLAALLETELNDRSQLDNEISVLNSSGSFSVEENRREIARGYLIQCEFLQLKLKKTKSKSTKSAIKSKLCELSAKGLQKLCPAWEDTLILELRSKLQSMSEKYACSR